jgi:hypothetical protein
MRKDWKKLLTQVFILLASEIVFNFLELDTLASYGEFVFSREVIIQAFSESVNCHQGCSFLQ